MLFHTCVRAGKSKSDSNSNLFTKVRLTHRVPLGVHLLLLKFGKLPAVVDDHEQFPDEQKGEADQHDARHHTRHDGDDVRSRWALCITENAQETK